MNKQYVTPDEVFFFHHTQTNACGETVFRPPEVHRRFEVFYLIRGEVEYVVEGIHYFVHAGDLLFIAAGKVHKLKINLRTDYERIVIQFDRTILPQYFSENTNLFDSLISDQNPARLIPKDLLENFRVKEILNAVVDIDTENKYRHPLFVAQSILFLVELNKVAEQIETESSKIVSSLVRKTINYIDTHLADDLSLSNLASELYVNKFYLEHLFRKEMDLSINRYITLKRIHIAAEMIRRGVSAQDACEKVGYRYYSTFFYNYKKVFGVAPTDESEKAITTLPNPDFRTDD